MGTGTGVEVSRTGHLAASRLAQIRAMLVTAFEGQFSEHDWQHTIGGWHVIVSVADQIVSHAAVVPRRIWSADHWYGAGYVEGVATVENERGQGYGTIAVTAVTEIVRDRYDLGALSTGTHDLYAAAGWESWQGTTSVQTATGIVPTPEENAGIMVYRFGPSANLALDGEIRCEARPGDDW